jgi:hypothetical protein
MRNEPNSAEPAVFSMTWVGGVYGEEVGLLRAKPQMMTNCASMPECGPFIEGTALPATERGRPRGTRIAANCGNSPRFV